MNIASERQSGRRNVTSTSGRPRPSSLSPLKDRATLTVISLLVPILAVPVGSGCSFIFVDGPPTQHERLSYFDCTTSSGWPIVDVALSALWIANIAVASGQSDSYYVGKPNSRASDIGFNIGFLALTGASAISGFTKVSNCNQAKEKLRLRLPAPPARPAGYPPLAPTAPVAPPATTPPESPPPAEVAPPAGTPPAGSPTLPPHSLMRLRFDPSSVSTVPTALPTTSMISERHDHEADFHN